MILYRVFPYDVSAAPTEPGGALFVPQASGLGRIDNAALYDVLYLSAHSEAAIAEAFGPLPIWRPQTFVHANGNPYALAAFTAPDDLAFFDLNDVRALDAIGIRHPSDVVTRDRTRTQAWAKIVFDRQCYVGARWWSFYNPDWPMLGLWDVRSLRLEHAPAIIDATHPAVRDAATAIVRQLTR